MLETCIGCGGLFASSSGPTHPYMLSSSACWHEYGLLLAREYENYDLFTKVHRLTVDAYALQHPGNQNDPRACQSVHIHYISLHLIFAHGFSHSEATNALKILANEKFHALSTQKVQFELTIKDVLAAETSEHSYAVIEWAKSAYDAWSPLAPFAEKTIQALKLAT